VVPVTGKLIKLAALAVLVTLVVRSIPDLKRYLRIRAM
jgi:hypothetical protein